MNNQYIISDLHLGHHNMALKRGFNNSEEHDSYLINQWNSIVGKKDTVYVLGDITMEKKTPYHLLDQLNGIKNIVLGNHDRRQDIPELLKYVNSVSGMVQLKGLILTHCPIHPSQLKRFRKNVHGHTHDKFVKRFGIFKDHRYINVSAEVINYKPVLISELLKQSI